MDVYRKKTIPVIYTELDFIRTTTNTDGCIIVDCAEDLKLLHELQNVAADNVCISSLEQDQWTHTFLIKAVFPDDILDRDGTSGEVIIWHRYYWKSYDAERAINPPIKEKPAEAVPLTDAGIDRDRLEELASTESCIRSLQLTEDLFTDGPNKNYELTKETVDKIKEIEKPLIAGIKLKKDKQKRLK